MRSALFVFALLASSLASAVVWRHDADPKAALKLAAEFPAVGRVLPDGTATLIAPSWALTAAHVAVGLTSSGGDVVFGGRKYRVKKVYIHPLGRGPEGEPPEVDLGLIELEAPVDRIVPLPVYRGHDELGAAVTIVGCGDFGAVGVERNHQDGDCRAVTNVVADAGPRRLFFPFEAPPAGTPLEGIGVAGDSGGPALVRLTTHLNASGLPMLDGAWLENWMIAGVSSGSDGPPGAYGTTDIYARVSSEVSWIEHTVGCGEGAPHVYPGPPRPLAELTCVSLRAGRDVSLRAVKAAGAEVPAGAMAFFTLPGTPEIEFECGPAGKLERTVRTPIIELVAGDAIRVRSAARKDGGCAFSWTPGAFGEFRLPPLNPRR